MIIQGVSGAGDHPGFLLRFDVDVDGIVVHHSVDGAYMIGRFWATRINAGTSSGVFKSSDGGTTWTGTLTNTDVHILVLDPSMSTTLYAGTTTRVATAQSLVPALAHDPPVHAIAQNSQPASYHHEVSPHRVAARTRAIAPAGVLSQLKTESRCHC